MSNKRHLKDYIKMADICAENRLISKTPLPELPENWQGKSFVEIIFSLCQAASESHPGQEWLRDAQKGDVLFLKEIKSKCVEAARVLSSHGVKEGDTVHVLMPNCVEFHVTVFAVWLLGGIASLSNPRLRWR